MTAKLKLPAALDGIKGVQSLTPVQQAAVDAFRKEMRDRVIPAVLEYQHKHVRRRLPL